MHSQDRSWRDSFANVRGENRKMLDSDKSIRYVIWEKGRGRRPHIKSLGSQILMLGAPSSLYVGMFYVLCAFLCPIAIHGGSKHYDFQRSGVIGLVFLQKNPQLSRPETFSSPHTFRIPPYHGPPKLPSSTKHHHRGQKYHRKPLFKIIFIRQLLCNSHKALCM